MIRLVPVHSVAKRGAAITRRARATRTLALVLLLALVLSELGLVIASAEDQETIVEQLAKRFRSLLAQYALGVIGYEEASSYLEALINCSKPFMKRSYLSELEEIASVLRSNTSSLDEKRFALANLTELLASSPPLTSCPSSLLYRVYLVASMDPTPLGLGVVNPAKTVQRLAAMLGSVLQQAGAGTDVVGIVFTYYPKEIAKGMNVYAAIHGMALTAALAGKPDQRYWRQVLLLSRPGVELIAALANPFVLEPVTAKRMLSLIAPSYSPAEPEQLIRLANESIYQQDYVGAATLAVLSTAAYPVHASLLTRIIQLEGLTAMVKGRGALSPSTLEYVYRVHTLPVKLLSPTRSRSYVVPIGTALALPRDQFLKQSLFFTDPFDKLGDDILKAGFNPINWSIIGGEASSLIFLVPRYKTLITITVLFLDPFTPLDPWILGIVGANDMPGTEEALRLLTTKGVESLVAYALNVAHPWPGIMAIAALNTYERGLLGPIDDKDAALIAKRAGLRNGTDPLSYAILTIAYNEALHRVSENRNPESIAEWLGYYTRYASIRVLGGRLVINYAYAQGLARLLVAEVPGLSKALSIVRKENPVLAYWALGLIETPYPVNTQVLVKEGLSGLEKAAARIREAAGTPAYANTSVELSRAAESLEKIASGIETGNLPQAVLLAKRIRETLESGGQEAELLRKVLGEKGVAELLRSLEQVETLGGQEAARVAAAKQLLDELAKQLEDQGEKKLAEKLHELANSLVAGNESQARIIARELASEKNPPNRLKPLVQSLRDLLEQNHEPGIRDIVAAVLGGNTKEIGQEPVISADELIRLIKEGKLGEAAKQLENITRSNPEEAAKTLQELSRSGINVSDILSYLNPDTVNKLIRGVLHSQERGGEILVVHNEGSIERAETSEKPVTIRPPGPVPPSLPKTSRQSSLAMAFLVALLVISTFLLWASSRPERTLVLRRVLSPVSTRLSRRNVYTRVSSLREQVVLEFDNLLKTVSQLYGPRKPSETHREYVERLPSPDRGIVADAALAYEEARFSSHPVNETHLERIRNALRKITRRG